MVTFEGNASALINGSGLGRENRRNCGMGEMEAAVMSDDAAGIRNYPAVQYILGSTYTLIMLMSLLGNLAVVLAVATFQQLKSLNHYLLMSLAAADLTVTVNYNYISSAIPYKTHI